MKIKRENKLYPSLDRKGVVELILLTQLVVLFPLFEFLPLWVTLICLAVITYRFFLKRSDRVLPRRITTAIIGLIGGLLIYLEFKTFAGRDAGVSLIVLMFSLKLMEMRWYRDAALILFLSFFIMVAHFLYSQTLVMSVYMVICLGVILTALQALNRINGAMEVTKLLKSSGKIMLQALPIMLILFLLFPRLSQPLWQMPSGQSGTSGISDSMTPGDIGSLVLFNEPAFRVRFDGDVPSSSKLYWRGLVFSDFDGLTWSRNEDMFRSRFASEYDIEFGETAYEYELLLEPHRQNWLFTLEMPYTMDDVGRMTTEYTWVRRFAVNSKLSYEVISYPNSKFGVVIDDRTRQINLELPEGFNPVSREWATELRNRTTTDEQFIQSVLSHINQQEYHYTLTPGTMGENGVDDFWFNQQRGFCEHYAGAFVFLMRSAGIPARVVTGYQGGQMNPYGDYMLVRQSDAHAWTEVWLEGKGWTRIDPTAAIHPSRVEVDLSQDWLQREALFQDQAPQSWSDFRPSFISKLSLIWDSVNSYWQNEVIDYNAEKQFNFLRKLGFNFLSMSELLNLMLVTLGVGLGISTAWLLKQSVRLDPIAKAYQQFNKKLSKNGLGRKATEGPWQHWNRIRQADPELATQLKPIIRLYTQLRYQDNHNQETELLRDMNNRVAMLK